jgi:hypothetical protein
VKRSSIIIVAGCLTALVLGLTLAYSFLVINMPVTKKESLSVDVVYAYFGTPYLDANISGLWRNYNIPQEIVDAGGNRWRLDVNVVSYFIVLNITNYSNQAAYITNFDTIAGPSISVGPNGIISAPNPILSDYRHVDYYPGWDNIWSANASRLIYLSGIVGVHDLVYSALNSTGIWIYEQVKGRSYGEENVYPFGVDYKQIPLQSFGQAHLYNNLVGENQTLIFYSELDVSVGTRLPQ